MITLKEIFTCNTTVVKELCVKNVLICTTATEA